MKTSNLPKYSEIDFFIRCMSQIDGTKYFVVFVFLKYGDFDIESKPLKFILECGEAVFIKDDLGYRDEWDHWQYPKYIRFNSIEECNNAIKIFKNLPIFPHSIYPLWLSTCNIL
jgi:hypothetical protein